MNELIYFYGRISLIRYMEIVIPAYYIICTWCIYLVYR